MPRRPDAAPRDRSTGRPPGTRRAVIALVGAVVVGTGLGAAGVSAPGAGEQQAAGAPVDLLAASPADAATAAEASREARAAAVVSSRSAARDAGAAAEAERVSDAAREGALAVRSQQAAQADADRAAEAAEAERQRAAEEEAAAQEAERQRAEAERAAADEAERAAAAADPRAIGRSMAAERGWGADQFSCLDSLWTKESDWTVTADNPTSSAYGIPQSLPGSKMASAGADWATNPVTQISWGLTYIRDVYGTPCTAWSHSQATDWY